MTVHVVFPAAGVGSRFGSELPKQHVEIAGKPVMEWTLRAWQQVDIPGHKVVVKSIEDNLTQTIVNRFDGYDVITGGRERADSVLNALRFLQTRAQVSDWVLIHDMARPCVRVSDIRNLLEQCQKHNRGGILACRLTDTIKEQGCDQVKTIDRSKLWAAQTPQCFRLGDLYDALNRAAQEGISVTDEASAIEYLGLPIQLIEGSSDNIKLTKAEDAQLVEFYLRQQNRI